MRTLWKVLLYSDSEREECRPYPQTSCSPVTESLEQVRLETRQEKGVDEVWRAKTWCGFKCSELLMVWVTSWLLGMQDAFCCFFSLFGNKLAAFEKEKPKGGKMTSCTSDWWPGDTSCVWLSEQCLFFHLFSLHKRRAHGSCCRAGGSVRYIPVPGIGVGAHSRSSGSFWWINKWRHTPRSRFCYQADADPGLLSSVPRGSAWSCVRRIFWVRAPRDCCELPGEGGPLGGGRVVETQQRALKEF